MTAMKSGEKDLRVIKTRRTIREALISLMAQKELSEITITELCARAMINRKTFYRHYHSVSGVISEFEDELLGDFSSILRSSNTSLLDIDGVIRDISSLVERKQDYFVRLLSLNPELFSKGRVRAMLRRAIVVSLREVCGISDEQTLSLISGYIVSGVLSLYAEWFDNGCADSLEKLTDTARKMTTNALRGFVSDEKLSKIQL